MFDGERGGFIKPVSYLGKNREHLFKKFENLARAVIDPVEAFFWFFDFVLAFVAHRFSFLFVFLRAFWSSRVASVS